MGDTRGDLQQVNAEEPLRYFHPSNSIAVNPEIVDPSTGALYRQIPVEGWAYGASTSRVGGCNIGTPGACAFQDAAGNGWSSNAGSAGSALAGADGAYVEYAGSGQEVLWVRLGGNKYPNNSTYDTALSFQNLRLTASCTGPNCGSGALEICFVYDVANGQPNWSDCAPGAVTVPLSGAETTMTVCADAPCSNPERPGDVIQFDKPARDEGRMSRGRVYTDANNASLLYFTDAADCARLFSGEGISIYHSPTQSYYSAAINSTACGAQPPSASVTWSSSVTLQYNGTDGVPFFYQAGIRNNPRHGVLIRRRTAAAGTTIRINQLLWRAASHVVMTMGTGSGGFGQRCTKKATDEGFYHCQVGPGLIAIKPDPLEVRFLGLLYVFGQSIPSVASGFRICGSGGNDFAWDDDDPNVFYCVLPSNYPGLAGLPAGRLVLLKMTYTGRDIACGAEGSLCRAPNMDGGETEGWPQLPFTAQILTPCLNGCARAEDDYTILGQIARVDASFNSGVFGGCDISPPRNNSMVLSCASGIQDSPSWIFSLDLGNRLAVGSGFAGTTGNTQQVIGSNPWFQKTRGRWCSSHTVQAPVDGEFTIIETSGQKCTFRVTATTPLAACSRTASGGAGNCDPCPDVTLDGVSYRGRNWCSSVQVTSSWDSSWGTAPAGFAAGDPVNPDPRSECPMRYLQKVKPGDYFGISGEWLRVLAMPSAISWIVERGIGNDQSINSPRQVAAGSPMATLCGAVSPRAEEVNTDAALGYQWFYALDPFGNGVDTTAFVTPYVNHAWHRGIWRGTPDYRVQIVDPTLPDSMRQFTPRTDMPLPSQFAGKVAPCFGNGCERHPSASQTTRNGDSSFFADVNPLLFIPSGANAATRINGNLYRFQGFYGIDPKHLPIVAFTSTYPLRNVSAPGVVLSGNPEDHGKLCIAMVPGECHSSSSPGQVFFNLANFDRSTNYCREALFASAQGDICIGNLNGVAAATTQWLLPTENIQQGFYQMETGRVVRRLFQRYREAATENVKIDPTGRYYMLRTSAIVKLPSLPTADNIRRSTFIPMTFSVTAPAGTDNIVAEFGYDAAFRCSENRAEACIASRTAVDEANPYTYPSERGGESGIVGISCPSSCSVTIPALSNRAMYWRIKYRNASNGLISAGPVQVTATP